MNEKIFVFVQSIKAGLFCSGFFGPLTGSWGRCWSPSQPHTSEGREHPWMARRPPHRRDRSEHLRVPSRTPRQCSEGLLAPVLNENQSEMQEGHFNTHSLSANTSNYLKLKSIASLSTGKARFHNRLLILLKSSPQIGVWWIHTGCKAGRADLVWLLSTCISLELRDQWRVWKLTYGGCGWDVLVIGPGPSVGDGF